jgi:hypothetical protein
MSGAWRSPSWLATCFLIAGCGTAGSAATASRTPAASATGAPTAVPAGTGSPQGASPAPPVAFSCSAQSGGDATLKAQLTDVRAGHHPGYDQLTLEFAAPTPGETLRGMPAYSVSSRLSTHFVHDGSGLPLTVDGSAGLLLIAQGSSGWDTLTPTLMQTYKGVSTSGQSFPSSARWPRWVTTNAS